jgi:steroid delta-isomerase-like uncharacterized protein
MSTEATLRDSVRNYAQAKNRHDIDALVAAYAPEGRYEGSGISEPITGHAQLRSFYGALFNSIPDYHGHFDGTALGSDTAVVWGRMTGTLGDNFLGLPSKPGSRIDVPVTFVCTFRDGLLLRDCGYFDTLTLRQQAGVIEAVANSDAGSPATVASFVAGWARFWAAPADDTRSLHDLITDDVALHWPGMAEPFRGRDAYAGQLAAVVRRIPDVTLSVTDYAHRDDVLILAWEGRGTIGGEIRRWPGVDRFRLRGGQSSETAVVFDTRAITVGAADQDLTVQT